MKALNKFISAVALVAVFAGAAYAQPANDLCANAITVSCGQTVTGNTDAATIDAAPACGLTFPRYGVWYRFNGTGQTVTLSTCSATTNYDTQIGVYSGSCTSLVCVAGNNNDAACATNGRFSTVTFTSVPGTTYFIWVTGVLSSRGNFAMSVSCTGGITVPNDLCANATLTTCGSTVTGSTVGATSDAVGTCTTALNTAPGVWYQFVGNGGTITASACGSSYDTKLGVFTGSCGALTCVAGNDDFCSLQSQVSFSSTNGVTYYLLVTGFSTNAGNYTVSISCTTPPPPTDNDNCAAATPIACGGSASGTTVTATLDGPATSCPGASVAADRWYSATGTGTTMTASLCGSSYDTKIEIYTGSCGALTCVGGNDDFCGLQSQISWSSVTGTTYIIRVHGFLGATGAYVLNLTCASPLAENNNPATAAEVIFGENGKQGVGEFFPNPAQFDNTNVKIYAPQETAATIVLHDNVGRLVYTKQVELASGANAVELNLSDLAIGTYFATIDLNGELYRRKLVVLK